MKARIARGCAAMGIALPADAADQMAAYWEAVLEANQSLNLTRVTLPEEACAAHFLDSLAPLLFGEEMIPRGATLIDAGTGAGFPGVALAIARPDLRICLLDARKKRLDFIAKALETLRISNARVLHARAEDHKGRYAVVCARAVAPLPKLCEWTLPLLSPGGLAIYWKGPGAAAEMDAAAEICARHRATLLQPIPYPIPERDWHHCLIAAEKRIVSRETIPPPPKKQNPCKASFPV